ncbi:MAG: hypothetical protein CL912_07065 [Deltaproteobacteria bacterium]|nr:hypothetical protein [Deltaproteobacteria bacterium]
MKSGNNNEKARTLEDSFPPVAYFQAPSHWFNLVKPVVEGRPWIASLLFRGSYWAAESHIGRHEAKRKVAERELSWLYSCDLHLSSNNCRYLTEKPCPASSRGQKGNGVWELELDWTALKTQSVRYYPHF